MNESLRVEILETLKECYGQLDEAVSNLALNGEYRHMATCAFLRDLLEEEVDELKSLGNEKNPKVSP